MLDKTQCEFLLKEDNIKKINDIFSSHKLTNIKIFAPQFSDQYGKINFLVTEEEDADPLFAYDVSKKIKKLLGGTEINIATTNCLDPAMKPIIEREIMGFSFESVKDYYQKKHAFDLNCEEKSHGKFVVTITFEQDILFNAEDIMRSCSQAIQKEIESKTALASKSITFF